MTISPRGYLDLHRGEELIVRLTWVGGMYRNEGRVERLLGTKRGFHKIRVIGKTGKPETKMIHCTWNNCRRYCERGWKREVKYETRLLWEGPNGLEERTAFLTPKEQRQFAKIATVIEREGRDPTGVRILWRHKTGTKGAVEVVALP